MGRNAGRGDRDLTSLASAATLGDERAFERLVVATFPEVYSLALRLVGNEQDALDVVQDTYVRAFRAIRRFRGDSAIETWLHRITANCSATHLSRSRAHRFERLSDEYVIAETSNERRLEAVQSAKDDRERLTEALTTLPYGHRAVVVLHDVYDLSHEVIAKELGITVTASKVRLHRARRRLRDLLYMPKSLKKSSVGASPPTRLIGLEQRATHGSRAKMGS